MATISLSQIPPEIPLILDGTQQRRPIFANPRRIGSLISQTVSIRFGSGGYVARLDLHVFRAEVTFHFVLVTGHPAHLLRTIVTRDLLLIHVFFLLHGDR